MWYSVTAHSISFKVAFVQCMAGRKAPLRRRILAFRWFVFCLLLYFMKLAFCLNSFLLDVFLQRIKTVDRPYSLVIFSSLQNVISTVAWLHLYSLLWTMWLKNWKKCFDGSVQSSLASVPHCLSSWHCFLLSYIFPSAYPLARTAASQEKAAMGLSRCHMAFTVSSSTYWSDLLMTTVFLPSALVDLRPEWTAWAAKVPPSVGAPAHFLTLLLEDTGDPRHPPWPHPSLPAVICLHLVTL